jgi:hypothetical protein
MANAKGTALLDAVKFLRSQREAARKVLPPALHGYLEERISVARWYPEEHLLELLRAMLPLIPKPRTEVLESLGRVSARIHLGGVYEHLAVGSDRGAIPRRVFTLWATMHDTGKMSVVSAGETKLRLELSDYALPSREMCTLLRGYHLESFQSAGLPSLSVAEVGCRCNGDPLCAWEVEWKDAPS